MSNPIIDARLALTSLRAHFEAKKAEEWISVQSAAEENLDRAVWTARQDGATVSKLCEWYGTTDRKTIYRILERARAKYDLIAEVTPVAPYTVTHADKPNQYKVTDGTHTVFVWGGADAVAPYKYAGTVDTDSANALGWPMRDPAHPAWAYVRELEAEGK